MSSRRFRARPAAILDVARSVVEHPANRGRRARALGSLATAEIRARVTGKPVVTTIGERTRIRAYLHRGGSWRVVRANPPDFAEMTVWRRHLRPGDLFVDVGAHAGVYTLWALDCGAVGIAVEPEPRMVEQLRENLALNHAETRVQVVAAALGAEPGRLRLAGPDLLRGQLVFGPTDDGAAGVSNAGASDAAGVEVRVDTLDAVLGDRHARGLKIDVEGAERLVLEGGARAFADGRIDLVQLEWNDCSQSLLGEDRSPVAERLRSYGYELYRADERGELVPTDDLGFGPDLFARRP